jgi:hypothetical protein
MAERSSAGDIALGVIGVGLGAALIVITAFRFRTRGDAQMPSGPQPEGPETTPPPPSPPKTPPSPAPPKVPRGPCSLELFRPWDKKDAPLTITVDDKVMTRDEAIAVCKAKGGGVRLETKGNLRPGESDEIYNALVEADIKFVAPWSNAWTSEFWKFDDSRGVERSWDPVRKIWRHLGPRPGSKKDASRLMFMMTSPGPSDSSSPMRFQQGEGPDMPSYSLKGMIARIKAGGRHDVELVPRFARPASADYARAYLFKSGILDVWDEQGRKWTLGPDSSLVDVMSDDPDIAQYKVPANKQTSRVAVSGNPRGYYGWSSR